MEELSGHPPGPTGASPLLDGHTPRGVAVRRHGDATVGTARWAICRTAHPIGSRTADAQACTSRKEQPIRLDTPPLVREIRVRAGISQEELARRLDVSFASVNAWERGRTEPRSLHRARLDELAAELGVRQQLTVVVIDDEPDVCELVELMITRLEPRATVTTATSGTDGLLACGAVQPDLVMLDMRMPGLDGLEVAAAMRRLEELQRTVLVFVTGTTESAVIAEARRVAATVVTKPLTDRAVARLLAMVDDDDVRRVGTALEPVD